jgi:hypothetical protein
MCFARTCTRHTVNRLGSVALATLLCILSWVLRSPAFAQEKELAAGHPVRLEDAFYVPAGEGSMLATGGPVLPNRGDRHGLLVLDLQYGLLPGTQLSVGTILSSDPSELKDPASDDLAVAGRLSLNADSLYIPQLAAQLGVNVPTGAGSRAVDVELKGYATKSLTLGLVPLFLHLNTSLEARAHGQGADERLLRYHVAVGPSFTLPWQAATTIVADIYVDQAVSRHAADTGGLELGARYRVSPILAVHAAVGTEVAGPVSRATLFIHAGFGIGFTGPAFRVAKP